MMKNWARRSLVILSLSALACSAQNLSPHWKELTAPDFVQALHQAKAVCATVSASSKSMAHLSDRHRPDQCPIRHFYATKQDYAIVYPEYYFGQIFEAKHQPGTIAYSTHLQLELLQETTAEMARNGCKKIVIVNGHGGNTNLIAFFARRPRSKLRRITSFTPSPTLPAKRRRCRLRRVLQNLVWMVMRVKWRLPASWRPGLSWLTRNVLARNRAPIRSGSTCPRTSTRESGGMRGSRITTKATPPELRPSAARLFSRCRPMPSPAPFEPSSPDQIGPRLQKEFFEESTHPVDTKQ